jgi:hypothetical protein
VTRQYQGLSQKDPGYEDGFGLVVGKSTRPSICTSSAPPPNHLVPVFSCEKALNIKKIKIKIKIEGLGLGHKIEIEQKLHSSRNL